MITFKRLDHFHVCVPPERLEEARLFYTGVIGLQQSYEKLAACGSVGQAAEEYRVEPDIDLLMPQKIDAGRSELIAEYVATQTRHIDRDTPGRRLAAALRSSGDQRRGQRHATRGPLFF